MSRDNFFSLINEHQIEFIDFRFTDMQGKWHHISKPVRQVSENLLKLGFVRNDLNLMPDLDSLFLDPFTTMPTLIVICDATSEQDPRLCAKRSIQFLIDSAIGDEVLFGMGLEFFIFDDVRFNHSSNDSFIKISHEELPESSKSK